MASTSARADGSIDPYTDRYFRVLAVPTFTGDGDDIIIRDEQGQPYLLTHDADEATPLAQDDVDALGMFFEPTVDFTWHTEPELRQMFYGSDGTSSLSI